MIVNVGSRGRLSKKDSDKLHIEVCERAAIASFSVSHHLQKCGVPLRFLLVIAVFSQCQFMYDFQLCVEVLVVGVASISSHVISWQNGPGVPCCGKACSPLVSIRSSVAQERGDKRQKEAVSSSPLASSPIFLPASTLRTESTDTARFPPLCFLFLRLYLLFTQRCYMLGPVCSLSFMLFYVPRTLSLSVSVTYIRKRRLAL